MARTYVKAAVILLMAGFMQSQSGGTAHASGALDKDSARCVSCHKDVMESEKPGAVCHMGDCSHPIGVDYASIAREKAGLRMPAELAPALKLVNNKIACTTCHVPYNEYDHRMLAQKRKQAKDMPDPMLAMDNTASRLCLGCHMK